MNVVKATTSGQITIPVRFRKTFKTSFFLCELHTDGIFFRPIEIEQKKAKKYKYTMENFKKWKIAKSKCPEEKNLSGKIDEIVYQI